jgi:hypothetical protein
MARGRQPTARRCRGGAIHPLLVTLALLGTLVGVAALVGPRVLSADTARRPGPGSKAAATRSHQGLIEDLAGLLSHSVGLLAIHHPGATPYEELVLWLTDDDAGGARGRPDPAEIAVLSHSRVLQTITVYRLGDGAGAGRPGLDGPMDRPAFCDRFRADPDVQALVLAGGVSAMRVEPVGDAREEWGAWGAWGGFQRLRLTLTWAADSADGADEASVLVDTVVFPPSLRR